VVSRSPSPPAHHFGTARREKGIGVIDTEGHFPGNAVPLGGLWRWQEFLQGVVREVCPIVVRKFVERTQWLFVAFP
jgi:hypothetical protein